MEGLKIDLTLSNLKTIKLWFFLVEKCKCGLVRDRELSRGDHETITKIDNAFKNEMCELNYL